MSVRFRVINMYKTDTITIMFVSSVAGMANKSSSNYR